MLDQALQKADVVEIDGVFFGKNLRGTLECSFDLNEDPSFIGEHYDIDQDVYHYWEISPEQIKSARQINDHTWHSEAYDYRTLEPIRKFVAIRCWNLVPFSPY